MSIPSSWLQGSSCRSELMQPRVHAACSIYPGRRGPADGSHPRSGFLGEGDIAEAQSCSEHTPLWLTHLSSLTFLHLQLAAPTRGQVLFQGPVSCLLLSHKSPPTQQPRACTAQSLWPAAQAGLSGAAPEGLPRLYARCRDLAGGRPAPTFHTLSSECMRAGP